MEKFENYLKPPQFNDENEQRTADIAYLLMLVLFFAAALITIWELG